MQNRTKAVLSGILAAVMILGTVLGIPFGVIFPAFAADEYKSYSSGAVLITQSGNYLIKNGVFSVTVTGGAKDVNIIFEDVKIDHRYAEDTNQTVGNLHAVAEALGWTTGTNTTATAQVCPLLITGNSTVTVAFRGENTLYAGTNGCTVSANNYYTKVQTGGGFAGVQVDAGSTLTIAASGGVLNAYGAYFVDTDNSNNVPNNTLFNSSTNNDNNGYGEPAGISHMVTGGGAGIGGGAGTSQNARARNYSAGTPGTIIINGGTINAYGGHQAAGIGGGINSAASASNITINGGTITAKGGRWAAGIGDGDSLEAYWSQCYTNSYQIVINGGEVEAIGGVGCPGIGSTDQLKVGNATSGLKIILNGGQVKARSGYPDGFKPSTGDYYKTNSNTTAAAAIGAGNGTNMAAQSIYLKSGVDIIASGFGHYSIKVDGVTELEKEQAPSITAEQSRLYNGRFPDLTSSADRIFTLYEALRATIHVTYKEEAYELHGLVFVSQATKEGEKTRRYFYDTEKMVLVGEVLDANGNPVHDEDGNVKNKILAWGAEEQDEIGKIFKDNHLTLYIDEHSTEIKSVTALKYFRSIALTLPDPDRHGGIYALRIPTSQVTFGADVVKPDSDFITVTIEANSTQNIWSEISYPSSYNSKLDAISSAFDKVDLRGENNSSSTYNGWIGESYHKSIYAYTVYIEPEVTSFWLYAMFYEERGVSYDIRWRQGINTTSEEKLTPVQVTASTDTTHGEFYILQQITMGATETEKDIILRKTDTGESKSAAHSVIYRITVKRKAQYTIELDPMDKVYDGKPASPSIKAVVGSINYPVEGVTQEELDSVEYTFSKGTNTISAAPKDAGTYSVSAVIHAETYIARTKQAVGFTISPKTLTVSRIVNYLRYVTSEELKNFNATIENPVLILNGVVSGDTVNASAKAAYVNNTIGYALDKIRLTGITLTNADGSEASNYTIAKEQRVFGQLSYKLDSAIFRKPDGSAWDWDKFYPVDSDTPVTKEDEHSKPDSENRFTSHTDYVYARTQGEGERGKFYACDIELGSMEFVYSELVWSPDTMEYQKSPDSNWYGFDGVKNKVTVINRSNAKIDCAITAEIYFLHAIHTEGGKGIGVGVYESNADGTNISGVATPVAAATPGDHTKCGTAGTKDFFVRLNGTPTLVAGGEFTAVGRLDIVITHS